MDPFYDLGIKEHTREVHRKVTDESDAEYKFVNGDIRDEDLVDRLVNKADLYIIKQLVPGSELVLNLLENFIT